MDLFHLQRRETMIHSQLPSAMGGQQQSSPLRGGTASTPKRRGHCSDNTAWRDTGHHALRFISLFFTWQIGWALGPAGTLGRGRHRCPFRTHSLAHLTPHDRWSPSVDYVPVSVLVVGTLVHSRLSHLGIANWPWRKWLHVWDQYHSTQSPDRFLENPLLMSPSRFQQASGAGGGVSGCQGFRGGHQSPSSGKGLSWLSPDPLCFTSHSASVLLVNSLQNYCTKSFMGFCFVLF